MFRIYLLLLFSTVLSVLNISAQNLSWIGDPTDFLPPDITVQFTDPNCTNDFDPCLWTGIEDGSFTEMSWIWEMIEGVHYTSNCPATTVAYSHVPCSDYLDLIPPPQLVDAATNSVLSTEVCVEITDPCDPAPETISYCFELSVQCGSCGETGHIFCEVCDEASATLPDGGCKLCDPVDLVYGYQSCTPPCIDPDCSTQPSQPAALCGVSGVTPQNMTWFAFIASSENLEIDVSVFNCIGSGLQSGIYKDCRFTECVGYDVDCDTPGGVAYEANFTIGQTYYLFIDGCNGAECEYELTIDGLEEMVPDDMDVLTAYSECRGSYLTDDLSNGASATGVCGTADKIIVCPNESIQFNVLHKGNRGEFLGNNDPCDTYPHFDALFEWTTSWGDSYEYNPFEEGTGEFVDLIEMPSTLGNYSICLDFIDYDCYPVVGPVCLDIEVANVAIETYIYDVCVADLEFGWDPALAQDDPNGDGYEWLGNEVVRLAEVLSWNLRGDGYFCKTFNFLEPDCNCTVPQELCIRPIGSETVTGVNLYMFTSQFEECDLASPQVCTQTFYEWTWNWGEYEEIIALQAPTPPDTSLLNAEVTIPGYNVEFENWSGDEYNCDTIIQPTVFVKDPPIQVFDAGCGHFFAGFDMDLYEMDRGPYINYPPVVYDSTDIQIIDCSNGDTLITQPLGTFMLPSTVDSFCVTMRNYHIDGAWWDSDSGLHTHGSGDAPYVWTRTTYGPYSNAFSGAGLTQPVIAGNASFCEGDITAKEFTVMNSDTSFNYIWNANPVNPNIVVTDISSAGNGSQVSIDLLSSWTSADCVTVVAMASCGVSSPTALCFEILSAPTVTIDPVSPICNVIAASAAAITVDTAYASVTPAVGDYEYTWSFDGTSVTTIENNIAYSSPVSGIGIMTVAVLDKTTQCSSVISPPVEITAIPALAAPVLICSSISTSEIEVSWNAVAGALGYLMTYEVDGVMNIVTLTVSDLSFVLSSLVVGAEAVFVIEAIGESPCFNSLPSALLSCTTSDCSPAEIAVIQSGPTYCADSLPGFIDLNDWIEYNAQQGSVSFTSIPANLIAADGLLDLSNLSVGITEIAVEYTYEASCWVSIDIEIAVLESSDPACMSNIDNDGDGVDASSDCDDNDPNNYPGNTEVCDGQDNNCDGVVDEGFTVQVLTVTCSAASNNEISIAWNELSEVQTYYVYLNSVYQGAVLETTYTVTGLASNQAYNLSVEALFLNGCSSTTGSVTCATTSMIIDNDGDGVPAGIDCDDNNPDSFPGNPEICDGIDNNCDGSIDEGILLDEPIAICVDSGLDFISIEWNEVPGAISYELTINSSSQGTSVITALTTTDYLITGLTENELVEFTLTAVSGVVGCSTTTTLSCAATSCEIFPPLAFVLCDELQSSVTFAWEAIVGIDSFVVRETATGILTRTTDLSFEVSGLGPIESVTLEVQPVHPTLGCSIGFSAISCMTICPPVPKMSEISCETGMDFVSFDWEDVPDVTEYQVEISIDGQTVSTDTVAVSNSSQLDILRGLDLGAEVTVTVVAINPDKGCENSLPQTANCMISTIRELGGSTVSIFPNPLQDVLYIKSSLEGLDYSLYDLDGLLLQKGILKNDRVDLVAFPSGIYLITIRARGYEEQIVERIVKL